MEVFFIREIIKKHSIQTDVVERSLNSYEYTENQADLPLWANLKTP